MHNCLNYISSGFKLSKKYFEISFFCYFGGNVEIIVPLFLTQHVHLRWRIKLVQANDITSNDIDPHSPAGNYYFWVT